MATKTKAQNSKTKAGEAQRNALAYTPGEALEDGTILDAGEYRLEVAGIGKPGRKGWRVSGPGKYPNRQLTLKALETDDGKGNEVEFRETLTSHPEAFFRVHGLARAAGYPKPFKVSPVPESPSDPSMGALLKAIDDLLEWIMEKGVTLKANIQPEEYQGRMVNRIKSWLPSEDGPADDDADGEGGDDDNSDAETIAASECEKGEQYEVNGETLTFVKVSGSKAIFKNEEGELIKVNKDEEVTKAGEPDDDADDEEQEEVEKIPAADCEKGAKYLIKEDPDDDDEEEKEAIFLKVAGKFAHFHDPDDDETVYKIAKDQEVTPVSED